MRDFWFFDLERKALAQRQYALAELCRIRRIQRICWAVAIFFAVSVAGSTALAILS